MSADERRSALSSSSSSPLPLLAIVVGSRERPGRLRANKLYQTTLGPRRLACRGPSLSFARPGRRRRMCALESPSMSSVGRSAALQLAGSSCAPLASASRSGQILKQPRGELITASPARKKHSSHFAYAGRESRLRLRLRVSPAREALIFALHLSRARNLPYRRASRQLGRSLKRISSVFAPQVCTIQIGAGE